MKPVGLENRGMLPRLAATLHDAILVRQYREVLIAKKKPPRRIRHYLPLSTKSLPTASSLSTKKRKIWREICLQGESVGMATRCVALAFSVRSGQQSSVSIASSICTTLFLNNIRYRLPVNGSLVKRGPVPRLELSSSIAAAE